MGAVYLVTLHNVTDPQQLQDYVAGVIPTLGVAEVLAVDEAATTLEGDARSRVVILRFESKDAALAWYNSEEYQKAKPLRLAATTDNWLGLASAFG